MFLNLLDEKEGKNFLELAKIAISVDDVIKESEEEIISTYRTELGLAEYALEGKPYEKIVRDFQVSEKSAKKVVVIEIAGALYADEEIASSEETWIKKLGRDLGFRGSEINRVMRWTQDFNDLLREAVEFIYKR